MQAEVFGDSCVNAAKKSRPQEMSAFFLCNFRYFSWCFGRVNTGMSEVRGFPLCRHHGGI